MAKGCGACGKMHAHSMLECIQGSAPKPTVERVPLHPELPQGTVTSTVHYPPSTVHNEDGTMSLTAAKTVREIRLPKNRAWEQRNPDRYRMWRRQYDRKRRSN